MKAKNRPYIKDRFQIFDSELNRWVKYNAKTRSFMQVKRDSLPFTRIEKKII